MVLHELLDEGYGEDGAAQLTALLTSGADPEARQGSLRETPLHVANRRRRLDAVTILLDHGADIDARDGAGKTAYAHAIRRGFTELVTFFTKRGADTSLAPADQFAVAVTSLRLDEARAMLAEDPGLARTGNAEEDRLLADVAGRSDREPVELLIAAGADLAAPALDGGSPLHQAAWFGQPTNARLLIEAGAPLDLIDPTHEMCPLGWAVHGSRFSGGAEERPEVYVELATMLLAAGATPTHPDEKLPGQYLELLLGWAAPGVADVLRA